MGSSTLSTSSIRVIDALMGASTGLTRAEISEQTALSAPTVGTALKGLKQQGLAAEKKTTPVRPNNGTGRPAAVWEATMPTGTLLGIDLGHRHASVLVADSSAVTLLEKPMTADLDVDRDGPAVLHCVSALVTKALETAGRTQESVLSVCVGMPAPIDHEPKVAAPGYLPKWVGVDVPEKLRALLTQLGGKVPISIENDANLGAIAERADGAAAGHDDFLYVKLSTGIGLGAMLAGAPYRGSHGRAAELGHRSVPAEAEAQVAEQSARTPSIGSCPRCGRLDCLENLASGAAILRQLAQFKPGVEWTLDDVVRVARADPVDEKDLREVVINATIRIGATVADAAELFDPSMIVLGGSLAKLGSELEEQVTTWLNKSSARRADVRVTPVDDARIDQCEALGAVRVAYEQLRRSTAVE